MEKGIIFVDDEENILNGLRRSLRRMRRDWKMEFALSGREAMDKIADGGFGVIVTDMRMPGMDGAELLERVHESHPGMLRIVLSGQCEEETIMRAVRYAHFFLSKPCNAENLQAILRIVCSVTERIASDEARRMAFGLSSVPVFARTVDSLIDLRDRGVEDTEKYTGVVSSDPMLAAKMLQLVHSQFFVTMDDLFSVKKAVEIVTARVLMELIEREGTFSLIDDTSDAGAFASDVASHMTLSADIARKAARCTGLDGRESVLVVKAARFHDIGMLLFIHEDPSRYHQLVSRGEVGSVMSREVQSYGFSHAQLGALLLCAWGFPEETISAVERHGSGTVVESSTKVEAVLRLSRLLAYGIREGEPRGYLSGDLEKMLGSAGISKGLKEIVETILQDYRESVQV